MVWLVLFSAAAATVPFFRLTTKSSRSPEFLLGIVVDLRTLIRQSELRRETPLRRRSFVDDPHGGLCGEALPHAARIPEFLAACEM